MSDSLERLTEEAKALTEEKRLADIARGQEIAEILEAARRYAENALKVAETGLERLRLDGITYGGDLKPLEHPTKRPELNYPTEKLYRTLAEFTWGVRMLERRVRDLEVENG